MNKNLKKIMSLTYIFLILTAIHLPRSCESISFYLDPDSRKCIREEVHKDVLVVGEYELDEIPSQKTNIEVPGIAWSREGSFFVGYRL